AIRKLAMLARLTRVTLLLALAALLALQFWSLRAPRRLHLPEQQRVATANPKIGIPPRPAGLDDEASIARSLEQVREMGAGWIVDLFPWAYAQPRSRYGYDWAGFDMVIRHAARQGLTVVARLDIVPEWARPHDSNDRYLDREHYVDYANYVAAFLQRYRPYGVRHVVIWNEPNLAFEWGRRPPDPEAYAALLKQVYPRAKAVAPDAVVIAGGLSPQPASCDGSERLGDLVYRERLYQAGAGPYFDMLAAHTYGAKVAPDAPPSVATINFRRVELLHATMAAFGDAHKQVIVTEGGWNDSLRWANAVLPSE